jgi:hypothetical protein
MLGKVQTVEDFSREDQSNTVSSNADISTISQLLSCLLILPTLSLAAHTPQELFRATLYCQLAAAPLHEPLSIKFVPANPLPLAKCILRIHDI